MENLPEIEFPTLAGLPEQKRVRLLGGLRQSLESAFKLVPLPQGTSTAAPHSARLGGAPPLHADQSLPLDRQGQEMALLFQTPLPQLHDDAAVLRLFVSVNYQSYRSKDRGFYKFVVAARDAEAALAPENASHMVPSKEAREEKAKAISSLPKLDLELVPARYIDASTFLKTDLTEVDSAFKEAIIADIESFNQKQLGSCYLLANWHNRLKEASQIAAFAANGVSYDDKRAADPLYAHLMEAALDWRLIAVLPGELCRNYVVKDPPQNSHRQSSWLVLIRQQDLKTGGNALEKAVVVIVSD